MARPHKYPLISATSASSSSPPQTPPIEPDRTVSDAVQILRDLAAGTDPITKTTLPDESPYQSAKVLRALQLAIDTVTYRAMKNTSPKPVAAGAAWSKEEDRRLVNDFREGVSVDELSRKHQRSRGAINSRLDKLGIVKQPQYGRPHPSQQFRGKARPQYL